MDTSLVGHRFAQRQPTFCDTLQPRLQGAPHEPIELPVPGGTGQDGGQFAVRKAEGRPHLRQHGAETVVHGRSRFSCRSEAARPVHWPCQRPPLTRLPSSQIALPWPWSVPVYHFQPWCG